MVPLAILEHPHLNGALKKFNWLKKCILEIINSVGHWDQSATSKEKTQTCIITSLDISAFSSGYFIFVAIHCYDSDVGFCYACMKFYYVLYLCLLIACQTSFFTLCMLIEF